MHTAKQLRFKIYQLRQDKVIYGVESIAVFIFALFTSAFLPNLLLRYVYSDQNLTEIPAVLEYIPVAAFVIGVGYFLYAMLGNWGRLSQIKKLEKELEQVVLTEGDDCECGHGTSSVMSNPSTSTESVGLLAEKMRATKTRKSAKRA